MKPSHAQWLKRLPALFEIPAPDPPRLLRRIVMMERNIMLPIKAVFIGIIFYSFDITPWVGIANSTLDVVVETVQFIFWFYILAKHHSGGRCCWRRNGCRWRWCNGRS